MANSKHFTLTRTILNGLSLCSVLAAAAIVSCTPVEIIPIGGEYTITVESALGEDLSKTALLPDGNHVWQEGDKIALIEEYSGKAGIYQSSGAVLSDAGRQASFPVSVTGASASQFVYTSVYPASSLKDGSTSQNAVITLPHKQSSKTGSYDPAADLLVSYPQTYSSQPASISARYKRLSAIVSVALKNLSTTEEVKSIEFSATKAGAPVAVAGTSVYDLATGQVQGQYGSRAAQNVLYVEGCSPRTFSGSIQDFTVSDFDWSTGAVKDSEQNSSTFMSLGTVFTCHPFELQTGDKFKLTVWTATKRFVKEVTLTRNLAFERGDVNAFAVDFTGIVGEDFSGNFARWESGADFNIGGASFDKSTFGAATLLKDGATITAPGVYFIDDNATVELKNSWTAKSGNFIFIANHYGAKAVVNTSSAPLVIKDSGTNFVISGITYNSNYTTTINSTGVIDNLIVDNCNFKIAVMLLMSDDAAAVKNLSITNSKISLALEDFQADNYYNAITRSASSGPRSTRIDNLNFSGNVVYPANFARDHHATQLGLNNDALPSNPSTCGKVTFNDNIFVNVAPYKSFVNWDGYELEMHGNVISIDQRVRNTAQSVAYNRFSLASTLSGMPLDTKKVYANAVYAPHSEDCTFHAVYLPETHLALLDNDPLEVCDYQNADFRLRQAPYCVQATLADGRAIFGAINYQTHTIELRHVANGDHVTNIDIYAHNASVGAITGSWPTKSVTIGSQTYTITLPDASAGTLSGYTLRWAEEFNGTDIDPQLWRRRPAYGTNSYLTPSDESLESVSDGVLTLWYKSTTDPGVGFWPEGSTVGYIAGGLDSHLREGFNLGQNGVIGRIEVRAKWTYMVGLWQAAWLLPEPEISEKGRYEIGGEIDIIEHLGNESSKTTAFQTIHSEYTVTNKTLGKTPDNCGSVRGTISDSGTGWHTYAVEVDSNELRFYVDGTKKSWYNAAYWYLPAPKTYQKSYWSSYSRPYTNCPDYYFPFNETDYHLILTAQVGGSWCGNPALGATIPSGSHYMMVDYIRYYTKN